MEGKNVVKKEETARAKKEKENGYMKNRTDGKDVKMSHLCSGLSLFPLVSAVELKEVMHEVLEFL